MKIFLVICCLQMFWLATTSSTPASRSWMEESDQMLKKAQSEPTRESILELGGRIRTSARFLDQSQREAVDLHGKLVQGMISIPGHAKLLVEDMESHASENDGSGHLRRWCLGETLCHLPSPETVAVLGSYLYDERFPTPTRGEEGSGAVGSNYRFAVASLYRLGIRGLESENFKSEGTYFVFPPDVERCRAWWAEVKSGRQPFSFRGKAVEYRFKPDGTWDSIPIANPADDAIKPSVVPAATQSTPARSVEHAVTRRPSAPWPWISAAVALILTALGFVIWKNRRGKAK